LRALSIRKDSPPVGLSYADVRMLKDNLDILLQYFQVDPKEIIGVLLTITKHNPCCKVIESVYKSTGSIHNITVEDFQDPKLMQNLSLMITDLKEYLLQKRMFKLEFVSKEYLSNSIDYMKACKNYQSRYLQNNLQDVLLDKTKESHLPLLKLAKTDVSKYVTPKNKESLPNLVHDSDSSPDLRLDKVNDYWKKSNGLVSQFVNQLTQPASHPKTHVVHMDPNLIKKYCFQKTRSSVPVFHWDSIRADRRKSETIKDTESASNPRLGRNLKLEEQQIPGQQEQPAIELGDSQQQNLQGEQIAETDQNLDLSAKG
jgi:hypothetical protein